MSNPVEIEIQAAAAPPATQPAGRAALLPGGNLSLDVAIKNRFAGALVCQAIRNAITYPRQQNGHYLAGQRFRVLQRLAGREGFGRDLGLTYEYRDAPSKERPIRNGERVIWIILDQGKAFRGIKALADTPANRRRVLRLVAPPAPSGASTQPGRKEPKVSEEQASAAIKEVIALLERPSTPRPTEDQFDKTAASLRPAADKAVAAIMEAFNRRDQSFAYRHGAVRILERLATPKARSALLDIAVGGSEAKLSSLKSWAARAYIATLKDKAAARSLLGSEDSGVLNVALLAVRGSRIDEPLLKRLRDMLRRKETEPMTLMAIRKAAASVMAADPGSKFAKEKVRAILGAAVEVPAMPDANKVYRPSYHTYAESCYSRYLQCLQQMKGADEALEDATRSASGAPRDIVLIARFRRGDQTVRGEIRRIIKGKGAMLRVWAVRSMCRAGAKEDLPLLRRLAESDPFERELVRIGKVFPVRNAARRAIREIEVRTTPPATQPATGGSPGRPGGKEEVTAARIAELIAQLGRDDYKQREKAQQALVQVGIPAIPALHAAASGKDPERAARAKAAIAEVEKQVWGEPVDGLQVRLRALWSVWKIGQTPTLPVDLRNRGTGVVPYGDLHQRSCRIEVDGRWYGWGVAEQRV